MTNGDVPGLAFKLFGGQQPPDRDTYVLSQGFARDLGKCGTLLPEKDRPQLWPPELGPGPGEATKRIDRRMLFSIARRAVDDPENPWAAAQLHSGIAFWGAPPGMPMQRACRPLGEPNAAANLVKVMRLVRGEGATSAYNSVVRGGRLAVKGLGPSYFTKFLYFGGFEGTKPGMPKPLILDDNVLAGLKWLTEQSWEQTVVGYGRYLDLAGDLAYELACEPDVIERRLFDVGESGS